MQTVVRLPLPIDLGLTLGVLSRGPGDPTMATDASGVWWRASRTPEGPATTSFAAEGDAVRVTAWGPGALWSVEAAPELLGARDTLDGFAPEGRLLTIHRRHAGMRIGRSRAVYEALLGSVCEQRVTVEEAWASHRGIVRAWGEPAPGPRALWVAPAPERILAMPDHEFRAYGLERRRAVTLRALARRAARAEETSTMAPDLARRRLEAIPGVGPWTAARAAATALGDADAVPLGDIHLPHTVTYAFTGEARGDEARMLDLLAPYAGHRGRVVRLIHLAGIHAPRFGPRPRLRAWRG